MIFLLNERQPFPRYRGIYTRSRSGGSDSKRWFRLVHSVTEANNKCGYAAQRYQPKVWTPYCWNPAPAATSWIRLRVKPSSHCNRPISEATWPQVASR